MDEKKRLSSIGIIYIFDDIRQYLENLHGYLQANYVN